MEIRFAVGQIIEQNSNWKFKSNINYFQHRCATRTTIEPFRNEQIQQRYRYYMEHTDITTVSRRALDIIIRVFCFT